MKLYYTVRETVLRLLLLFVLTIFFMILCLALPREAERLLPRGTEYTAAHITFAELTLAGAEIPNTVLAGRRDSIGIVSSGKPGGEAIEARIALVSPTYFHMQSLTLLQGDIPEEYQDGPFALIGDELARRLFLTMDCIGNRFSVEGQIVTVSGVFEEPRSLLHRISSDGRDLVYLLAGPEAADTAAEQIFLCDAGGSNVREETFHQLNSVLHGGIRTYMARDWEAAREGLHRLTRFLFFLLRLILAVFLLRIAFPSLRYFPVWYRETGHRNVRSVRAVSRLLPPILCIAAAFILLTVFRPHILIPREFFPEGNHLLDFRHYLNIFVNGFIRHNTASYSYGSLVRYYGIWAICASGIGMLLSLLRLLDCLSHCFIRQPFIDSSAGERTEDTL